MAFISLLLQIFWQTCYINVPGVVLYQPYEFCQNHWFWFIVMATERLNFRKKKSKIFLSEAVRGMKLSICINVHDICLYINWFFFFFFFFFFFLSLSKCFCCYDKLKFPYTCTYNGKRGNWHLFLCYCRYFDKYFTDMFFGVVLYQPYEFCPNSWFDWWP